MAKKSKVNICAVINTLLMIAGIIYIIVCFFKGNLNTMWIRLVFCMGVLLYLMIHDVVEPISMNRFRHKMKRQMKAYYLYVILDFIGMAGLLWFGCLAGLVDDYTHYAGVLIFVVCMVPKRYFYARYKKRVPYALRMDLEDEEELLSD